MVLSRTRKQTRFVVLPPARLPASNQFRNIRADNRRYDQLLAAMQRFRGEVYLSDGAIQTNDLVDGRHKLDIDERSWHVLSLDSGGRICGCLRYLNQESARGFDDLWVRHAALADCPTFGARFRKAVEAEMRQAKQMSLGFGEVGGWAVAKPFRATAEALRIILTSYGLGQLLGGCTGVATATFRHCSAAILRKIGLNTLQWDGAALPPYFDNRYGCQMEVLRFDTRYPNPKYESAVRELSDVLAESPVICHDGAKTDSEGACHEPERGMPVTSLLQGLLPQGLVPLQPATAWY